MIIIHRTYDLQQAQIMVSFLRANDINATLLDAEMASTLPLASRGVRIAVDDDQASGARQLLREKGVELDQQDN